MKNSFFLALISGLLIYALGAGAVSALDLGDGKFVFLAGVAKEDAKGGAYIINDGDAEYSLGAAQIQNNKSLNSVLTQAVKDDLGVRFSGVWAQKNGKKALDPANLKAELIRSTKDCPEKTFSTHKITGIFMGTDCGDFCYTSVKDANGREVTMYGDTEDIFGSKPGIKVSIDYESAQAWLDTGDWGMCVNADFFKSGKKLN